MLKADYELLGYENVQIVKNITKRFRLKIQDILNDNWSVLK